MILATGLSILLFFRIMILATGLSILLFFSMSPIENLSLFLAQLSSMGNLSHEMSQDQLSPEAVAQPSHY